MFTDCGAGVHSIVGHVFSRETPIKEIRFSGAGLVSLSGVGMHCKSCGSVNQRNLTAEIGIHFPGLENIDKPVVWVFPEIVVCLGCGTAEFLVPEADLRELAKGDATAAG